MLNGTKQVGQRLVRQFGHGMDMVTVITEARNGKTMTKVFDIDAKQILSREKVRDVFVGDKRVSTKKLQGKWGVQTMERVYDKAGKFFGQRNIFISSNGEKTVKKITSDGIIRNKFMKTDGILEARSYSTDDKSLNLIYCNNLGLPIPYPFDACEKATIKKCKGKSLQDMLRMAISSLGGIEPPSYFPMGSGLQSVRVKPTFDPLSLAKNIDMSS